MPSHLAVPDPAPAGDASARLRPWAVSIRCLWPHEQGELRRHLQRLDGATRIERFGRGVSDELLVAYAAETDFWRGAVLGCWIDGVLRGVGELRRYDAGRSDVAEAALSLEPAFQNLRLGSALSRHLTLVARNRGIATINILSQASNARMLHIMRRQGAAMHYVGDQIEAELKLPGPSVASIAEEWMVESRARLGELVRFPRVGV